MVPFLTGAALASKNLSLIPTDRPICTGTILSFPHWPDHCVQWAQFTLEQVFTEDAQKAHDYLVRPDYLATSPLHLRQSVLEALHSFLVAPQTSLEGCVVWARLLFHKIFDADIRQLLYTFPPDLRDASGRAFWTGTKRAPTPLAFDPADALHLAFVVAAAHMRAYNLNIVAEATKPADLAERVVHIMRAIGALTPLPVAVPRKMATKEEAEAEAERVCADLVALLPHPGQLSDRRINVVRFDRDDDRCFPSDFIFCAATIRAAQYRIPSLSRLQCKARAGNISPGIVTTAAAVGGLLGLEVYKLTQAKSREVYSNSTLNLALPALAAQTPPPAPSVRWLAGCEVTPWDRIDVHLPPDDATLAAFLQYLKLNYGFDVEMIGCGAALLYAYFMPDARKKERFAMPMRDVIARVTKMPPLPLGARVELEISASILEEDVETPPIILWL